MVGHSDLARRIAERICEVFDIHQVNAPCAAQIIDAELAGVRDFLLSLNALWGEDGHDPESSVSQMYFTEGFISNWRTIREILASLEVTK